MSWPQCCRRRRANDASVDAGDVSVSGVDAGGVDAGGVVWACQERRVGVCAAYRSKSPCVVRVVPRIEGQVPALPLLCVSQVFFMCSQLLMIWVFVAFVAHKDLYIIILIYLYSYCQDHHGPFINSLIILIITDANRPSRQYHTTTISLKQQCPLNNAFVTYCKPWSARSMPSITEGTSL